MPDDLSPLQSARDEAEILVMDLASRIQLTATQHTEAETNYNSLAKYVDAAGSPLEGKVTNVYASGSFAIGAPILGKVKSLQHDLDAVLEIDLRADADPQAVLETLETAIKRERGSRYFDKTRRNSRCVTVTYDDGRSVDLMPVVRLAGTPDKVSNLFHWKAEEGESYHKQVNPKGFAAHFLANARESVVFEKAYARRSLVLLEKAQTEKFPEQVPHDHKMPRVVALQLIKRMRDIVYRRAEYKDIRKPPSVVLAALALDATTTSDYLIDEVIAVATAIRDAIVNASAAGEKLVVRNPAWTPDIFTDRWPKNRAEQNLFARDLAALISDMRRLASDRLDVEARVAILRRHFGETAALHAVDELAKTYGAHRDRGRTSVSRVGTVTALPSSAQAMPKRTPFGGDEI